MLSAAYVTFISRPLAIDGKLKKASERGEKFLLLLEQWNCPTPRTVAGKATGGSGRKRGKGRQGPRNGRASPMLLGVLQHGVAAPSEKRALYESEPGRARCLLRSSHHGQVNLALRIREIIAHYECRDDRRCCTRFDCMILYASKLNNNRAISGPTAERNVFA